MDWQYFGAAQDQDMERVLARRDQQQALVMRLMQEAQARQMDERQMSLAERRANEDRDARAASLRSLDDDRKMRAEDRKTADEDRNWTRTQADVKLMKPGRILQKGPESERFEKHAPYSLKAHTAGDEHGPDEHFEFTGTQEHGDDETRRKTERDKLDADIKYKEILGAVAQGKLDVAQALAAIAKTKADAGPRPRFTMQQLQDGSVVRVNVETGEATSVNLPGPVKGTARTPEQIFKDSEAAAAGRHAGTPAKGGGFLSGIAKETFGPKPVVAAPAAGAPAMVKMRHPKTGATLMVPAAEVAAAEANGAKRIQ